MKSKREKKIKVALVDDHHVVRKALCKMLVDLPTIEVAFDAADGKQFLEELTHHHIDVVLLDLEMPVMNGWQTIKALQAVTLKPKIIVLTMHADHAVAAEMLNAGADAYLLKECSIDEMQQARELLASMSDRPIPTTPFELNERQIKLLHLICDGFTSMQISDQMATSKKNIDRMRTQLMKKFDVSSGNELIRVAILYGLYKPRSNQQISTELQNQELESQKRRLARLTKDME